MSGARDHLIAFRAAVEAMEDAVTHEESEARATEALYHAIRLDRVADLGRLLATSGGVA